LLFAIEAGDLLDSVKKQAHLISGFVSNGSVFLIISSIFLSP